MRKPLSTPRTAMPAVLPMRRRAEVIHDNLKTRLRTVLPVAMREAGLDMWIILCQEDNPDPVFSTMIPVDTWCPIVQLLVFHDRGPDSGIEGINIGGTSCHDLYEWPYKGQLPEEQWPLLRKIVAERDPQRIGVNIGSVEWAGGGLTHNLHKQLCDVLGADYSARLVSAEAAATRWLETLTDDEVAMYEHVVAMAHGVLAECFSRKAITPGVTTVADLEWYYWQRVVDLGLEVSFKPYFGFARSPEMRERYGADDRVIRHGDLVTSDVGLKYLRLCTDHQERAYVLRPGETDAPEGLKHLMAEANRLQDVFMSEFREGLTGNELLSNILTRARAESIPQPRVYSHSLGYYLHEPGPLIGLPWEQERCVGRGDVKLVPNSTFTAELCVRGPVPEWGDQEVTMGLEEDVVFTGSVCRPLDGRQVGLYLV